MHATVRTSLLAVALQLYVGATSASAAPAKLDMHVVHKSADFVNAHFRSDHHSMGSELHLEFMATTSNFSIHQHGIMDNAALFHVSSTKHEIGKHQTAEVVVGQHRVLLVESAGGGAARVFQLPHGSVAMPNEATVTKWLMEATTADLVAAEQELAQVYSDIWKQHHAATRAMIDMSAILGVEHSINGGDFPHAQRFHLLALRVAEDVLYTQPLRSTKQLSNEATNLPKSTVADSHRALFSSIFTSPTTCNCKSNSRSNTRDSSCEQCAGCYGSDCLGMCGPSCHCWKWVCDTCCVQNHCQQHDRCCNQYGFSDNHCWKVVEQLFHGWGSAHFPCSNPYSCTAIMSGHK